MVDNKIFMDLLFKIKTHFKLIKARNVEQNNLCQKKHYVIRNVI